MPWLLVLTEAEREASPVPVKFEAAQILALPLPSPALFRTKTSVLRLFQVLLSIRVKAYSHRPSRQMANTFLFFLESLSQCRADSKPKK